MKDIKNRIGEIFNEDRAVSPVIGVILMVAITVILAAIIGTFVLGLGDSVQETAPNAQFTTDYNGDATDREVTFTHQGGDSIDTNNLVFRGEGVDGELGWDGGETVSAGDSDTLVDSEFTSDGGTVNLVWTSSNEEQTRVLASFDVPEAEA